MPTIGIIDDQKSSRESLARLIRSMLKKMKVSDRWSVVSDGPPPNESDILEWLDQNDATVLVADWRLNEGAKDKRVVNYEANRLIETIRARRPSFPIYLVTSYPNDAEPHGQNVESIYARNVFVNDIQSLLPRMMRAGLRRHEEQREVIQRVDVLARKAALGKASAKDKTDLVDLQGYVQTDLRNLLTLDEVLGEFETIQQKADKLRKRISQRLKGKKKK